MRYYYELMHEFRHATCNEAFKDYDFRDACRLIRSIGYTGIEIAPFTLAADPLDISPDKRIEYRRIISEEGLSFVGLHWLMVSPKPLHVTTADESLRKTSWEYVRNLVDLCADLGPGGLMVFGSPKQRGTTPGTTRQDATRRWQEGLAGVASHAEARGVTILVEALPASQCDVVQTLDEAVRFIREIGSPAVQTMFDSHNAEDEVENHATLVERHFDLIRHVHVNEMDGSHPGAGDYNFLPIFDVLRRKNYSGWISLEAFNFDYGPEKLARESLRYLESVIERLPQ
ncbi:MAG TPA: sugar phosphate isomerase/epimerase family protein [Bryobacteraceae bacterium]|nr:sugar phosphate isomerase/epimerase family protein [Bryobacteraceae bacterium]